MTLEQKAEEYAINMWGNDEAFIDERNNCKQDYIAGAKENGVIWHNLRKDPNDLPKGHRVVLNQVGMATNYDPKRGFLGFEGAGIIAWCEIPLFKESK